MGDLPVAPPATEEERQAMAHWAGLMIENAPAFLSEVESRGTRVVMVYVPWTDSVSFGAAQQLAVALGRPLVVAWPDGLMSAVGSHMGEDSAVRYVSALMPQLLALPAFKEVLAGHGSEVSQTASQ
jgi:hypothetical protein